MVRVMAGMADLAGTTVGTLLVGDLVSRQPTPRWAVVCSRCRTKGSEQHSRLVNGAAVCRNSACGREKVREAQSENPLKAKRRSEETETVRRRKEEAEAAAKLKAAEETFAKTSRELAGTLRDRIATQRDDEAYVDPTTIGISMTQSQADKFNSVEAAKFVKAHPEFYASSTANRETLGAYFDRNSIAIVSELTLAAAVRRLDEYGLLEHRPAPVPTPQPNPVYVELSVDHGEPEPTEEPDENIGIDQTTGQQRRFSNFEIGRMDAETYRKVFSIDRHAQLARSW